jgi:hypothetical protein
MRRALQADRVSHQRRQTRHRQSDLSLSSCQHRLHSTSSSSSSGGGGGGNRQLATAQASRSLDALNRSTADFRRLSAVVPCASFAPIVGDGDVKLDQQQFAATAYGVAGPVDFFPLK